MSASTSSHIRMRNVVVPPIAFLSPACLPPPLLFSQPPATPPPPLPFPLPGPGNPWGPPKMPAGRSALWAFYSLAPTHITLPHRRH